MNLRTVGVVICLLFVQYIFAQDVVLEADSLQQQNYDFEDGRELSNNSFVTKQAKIHSPKRATIYEMLVPGLGHIYNKKYWNVPVAYAGFGVSVFFIMDNGKKYKKYRNAYADFSQYRKFLEQSPQFPLPIAEPTSQRFREVLDVNYLEFTPKQIETFQRALKNNKDAFRRYRDLSYISLAAVYVLNVIWATVDAHFFEYDVSDDLSLRVQPNVIITDEYKQGLGVNVVLSF